MWKPGKIKCVQRPWCSEAAPLHFHTSVRFLSTMACMCSSRLSLNFEENMRSAGYTSSRPADFDKFSKTFTVTNSKRDVAAAAMAFSDISLLSVNNLV